MQKKYKFNIITDLLMNRPASWSFLSSWEYDKEEWYRKYIENIPQPTSPEMEFGKKFAQSIEDGTCTIRELMERIPHRKEYPFRVMFGRIPLIGYADEFDEMSYKALGEVKTGVKKWDQKRVDAHGQITMYCLMNYIQHKVVPEDVVIHLHWLPTVRKEGGDFSIKISFKKPIEVHTFRTKRTMQDILKFADYINRTLKDMEEYVNKKRA